MTDDLIPGVSLTHTPEPAQRGDVPFFVGLAMATLMVCVLLLIIVVARMLFA